MKSEAVTSGQMEKVNSGWFRGCNSMRFPWQLDDNQYRFGVNVDNTGGVIQTRPGKRMRLTLPPGNLQGGFYYRSNRDPATSGDFLVFAVDGRIYYAPFPLVQPADWNSQRLQNIQFDPNAKKIYFCQGEKTAAGSELNNIRIVPSYFVLIMQDGVTPAAFWDGEEDRHMNQASPDLETPIGTWMEFSGNRLWVANGSTALAGDLADPLRFSERVAGEERADYKMSSDITGMKNSIGENRQTTLNIFTSENTSNFLTYITDRDTWKSTPNFQTLLFPSIGCIAGGSIINHAGLLFWYTYGGLVASDSAVSFFASSQIRYRDVEMAFVKKDLIDDLSGIVSASFQNYLLIALPTKNGSGYNNNVIVLNGSVADELDQDSPPCWMGTWTGTRPVAFAVSNIQGKRSLYEFSVDYQSVNGSFNHVWENFMNDRSDIYEETDSNGDTRVRRNRIYCDAEIKQLGDGRDLKTFRQMEVDVINVARTVDFKGAYRGTHGAYNTVLSKRIQATIDNEGITDPKVEQLFRQNGFFSKQTRHLRSKAIVNNGTTPCQKIETGYNPPIDKCFSARFQWCGQLAIEAVRLIMAPFAESSDPKCEEDEDTANIVLQNGINLELDDVVSSKDPIVNEQTGNNQFVSPFEQPYPEVFYSSIPVAWQENSATCQTCLTCARDTFEPRLDASIIINGQKVS